MKLRMEFKGHAPAIVMQQAEQTERDGYEAIRLRSAASTYSNKWDEAKTENLAQAEQVAELEANATRNKAKLDHYVDETFAIAAESEARVKKLETALREIRDADKFYSSAFASEADHSYVVGKNDGLDIGRAIAKRALGDDA